MTTNHWLRCFALAALALGCACHSTATRRSPDGWQSNVDFGFAGRIYEDDAATSGADSTAMNLGFAARPAGSALGAEAGLVASVGGAVVEGYAGPRLTLADPGPGFRPYVGAGIAVLAVRLERLFDPVITAETDNAVGGYAHGGVYYEFENGVTLGVDARGVFGSSYEQGSFSGSADYVQLGLTFGSAF